MPVMKQFKFLIVSICAVTALSACAGAPNSDNQTATDSSNEYPVSVDSCGHETTIESKPERVVTSNQATTEVALTLGVEDQLVGTAYLTDQIPRRWEHAYQSVDVLSDQYPDRETLLSVKPDFVYSAYEGAFDKDNMGSRQELEDDGIPTYVSPFDCSDQKDDISFDAIWKEIDDAASIFGVPDRGKKLISKQKKDLESLKDEKPGDGLRVFWYAMGDKTPRVGGAQGGAQIVIDAIGAENIFANIDDNFKEVSWEKVLKTDPDVIVLPDMSWSKAKDKISYMKNDPALKKLDAVQEENFVKLDYSQTTSVVRLIDAANEVADQITSNR